MFQFIGHRKMKIPGLGGALHICTFPRNHEFRAGFRVYGVTLKLSPFVGNEMFHVFQEVYLWAWGCSEGWDCSLISLISFFSSVIMFQILGIQPETTFSSIPCHQGGYDHVTNFWPMGFNWKGCLPFLRASLQKEGAGPSLFIVTFVCVCEQENQITVFWQASSASAKQILIP